MLIILLLDVCLHCLLFGIELLEFLGFDFDVLLQGCVGALELPGLLTSNHHLLLHFLLVAFFAWQSPDSLVSKSSAAPWCDP